MLSIMLDTLNTKNLAFNPHGKEPVAWQNQRSKLSMASIGQVGNIMLPNCNL